jgi:hypothetical protein
MAISKFNYNSFNVTPVAGAALAFDADADGFSTATATSMVLIKTLTASSSATLSFVDGASSVVLDNTYKEYLFTFNNMHPATDNVQFSFQGSTDGGSSYGVTITSTFFRAYNYEGGTDAALEYDASEDLAQSTSFQILSSQCGNNNDQSCSGYLHLFNPSSTTFVKHFIAKINNYHQGDYSMNYFPAGYFNSTSAIDAIQFKMSSGNIDAGTIKLYGIKDS